MTDPAHQPASAEPSGAAADKSLGELVQGMSNQITTLVRDEIRLATIELSEKGKRAGIGAGLFGGAAGIALYGLGALVAAAIIGLAHVVTAWLAALIVAFVLFVVAGIAAMVGKKEISQATPPAPKEAISGLKADVAAVKDGVRG